MRRAVSSRALPPHPSCRARSGSRAPDRVPAVRPRTPPRSCRDATRIGHEYASSSQPRTTSPDVASRAQARTMAHWRTSGRRARSAAWNSAALGGDDQPAQLDARRARTERLFAPVSAGTMPSTASRSAGSGRVSGNASGGSNSHRGSHRGGYREAAVPPVEMRIPAMLASWGPAGWAGAGSSALRLASIVQDGQPGWRSTQKDALQTSAVAASPVRKRRLPGSHGLSPTTLAGWRPPRMSISSSVPCAASSGRTIASARERSTRKP